MNDLVGICRPSFFYSALDVRRSPVPQIFYKTHAGEGVSLSSMEIALFRIPVYSNPANHVKAAAQYQGVTTVHTT